METVTITLWQQNITIETDTNNITNSTWPPPETKQMDTIPKIIGGCIVFIFLTAAVWGCVGVCFTKYHRGALTRKSMVVAIRISLSFIFVLFTLIAVLACMIQIATDAFFPYRLIVPAILLIVFILIAVMWRRHLLKRYPKYKPDKNHRDMTVEFFADEVPTSFIVKDNKEEDTTNHKPENQKCSKYAFPQGNKQQCENSGNSLGYAPSMQNNYDSCTRDNEKNEGLYRMCELEDFTEAGNEKKDLSYVSEKVKL